MKTVPWWHSSQWVCDDCKKAVNDIHVRDGVNRCLPCYSRWQMDQRVAETGERIRQLCEQEIPREINRIVARARWRSRWIFAKDCVRAVFGNVI